MDRSSNQYVQFMENSSPDPQAFRRMVQGMEDELQSKIAKHQLKDTLGLFRLIAKE